jgi:hypothetical protein
MEELAGRQELVHIGIEGEAFARNGTESGSHWGMLPFDV